jgi:dipeptidyl aminopeptidase/acylaminoacyl peptidase
MVQTFLILNVLFIEKNYKTLKMKNILIATLIFCLIYSCNKNNSPDNEKAPVIIGKKELKLKSDLMTPEVLWSFGRVSEPEISPDGKKILYGVTYYSVPENKANRELFVMNIDGSENKQITKTGKSESYANWTPDGSKITYVCACTGDFQLWQIDPDGNHSEQISEIEGGITGYKFSPDMKKILFSKEVKMDKTVSEIYPDLDKANAKIITDLMYRHWDTWVDTYSHLFVADFDGKKLSNVKDIMEGEAFDSPLKPFGGMEEVNWSPNSKEIAYTSRKKKGLEYTLSTNSDIYIYNLDSKTTENISLGMMGYDRAPVYSHDGKKIAWESMERDGYEADKIRLMVYDYATKEKKDYSKNFDQNAEQLTWSNDDKKIYFISDFHARDQIYELNLESEQYRAITKGDHDYVTIAIDGDKIIGSKQSITYPTEVYSIDIASGNEKQLTFENKPILDQLALAKVEERWVKTTDNKQMLVWVIFPPHFDPAKKYPALLYCQGGPQSTVSQFFSYRWNFQMMAASGYIVVAPNRRGLPGFGQAWNEQISGDYGGQNMKDYLSAIDEIAKEPYVNKDKLGAVGASYGGFSVLWLAGNHNKRFKAFIAHDGIFNLEAMYLETDEMWFVNWDLGGPYWDKSNKTAQKSYVNSPHKFVDKWDTPIMIVHGGKDYRIPETQAMAAFNAAIVRKIPAKLLYFPEENHWVMSPQNGILWQREFFGWLDKYLK